MSPQRVTLHILLCCGSSATKWLLLLIKRKKKKRIKKSVVKSKRQETDRQAVVQTLRSKLPGFYSHILLVERLWLLTGCLLPLVSGFMWHCHQHFLMSKTPSSTEDVFKYVIFPFPLVTLHNFRIQVFNLLPG